VGLDAVIDYAFAGFREISCTAVPVVGKRQNRRWKGSTASVAIHIVGKMPLRNKSFSAPSNYPSMLTYREQLLTTISLIQTYRGCIAQAKLVQQKTGTRALPMLFPDLSSRFNTSR
jgi:hypothetical protein